MFEFFIALFGGAYYAGRHQIEKQRNENADVRNRILIQNLSRDYEDWVSSVVDIKLEYNISKLSDDEIEKMAQRIINEACIETITPEMVVMGLLAQKAKIPKNVADYGVRSRGVWDYAEQQMWTEQRRFMLWYDKELRRNGLQEPMLFVDGVNEVNVRHNINVANPITNTSRMVGGRYFWKPMRANVY